MYAKLHGQARRVRNAALRRLAGTHRGRLFSLSTTMQHQACQTAATAILSDATF